MFFLKIALVCNFSFAVALLLVEGGRLIYISFALSQLYALTLQDLLGKTCIALSIPPLSLRVTLTSLASRQGGLLHLRGSAQLCQGGDC